MVLSTHYKHGYLATARESLQLGRGLRTFVDD